MKPIKFDLPLNGTKVHNLEELRDNFTTEILEHHASGLLLKWLKSRNLTIEAGKLSAIPANHNPVDNLVALCDIFGIDTDRQVIEAALSKGQPSQGVALSQDLEEMKYKEKFEKLSELLEGLKVKKLYLTQDDYKLFVKNKIQIDNEGTVEGVIICDEIFVQDENINLGWVAAARGIGHEFRFDFIKRIGDVVEVGDIVGSIICNGEFETDKAFIDEDTLIGSVKSPLRGVLVKKGEIIIKESCPYANGNPICYIRIDHDTTPTIKIIPE